MAAQIEKPMPQSNSLYVGNLAPEVQENHLYEKFGPIGPISSVRVCRDSVSRRSLGYAYVNFNQVEHAKEALDKLNAETLIDRPMRVAYVNRDPSTRRSGAGNTFIQGLAKNIDAKSLLDTMAQFGKVVSVKISTDPRTGQSRGYGFVQFNTEEEARNAISQLNGMTLEEQVIKVDHYKTKLKRKEESEKNFTNTFIKGLPQDFTDDQLAALFGQCGEITRHTVRKTDAGVGKGFGFVEFKTHSQAAGAVERFNNHQLDPEHKLLVERALKKTEIQEKKRIPQHHEGQPNNLYVKNLDDEVTDDKLRDLFGKYGNIKSICIKRDDTGRPKGFGFVAFDTQEAATKAASELNCMFFGSKPLYVAKFQTKAERTQHLQMVFRQPQPQMRYPGYFPYPPPGMLAVQPAPYPPAQFPPGRRAAGMPMGGQQRPPRGMGYAPPMPAQRIPRQPQMAALPQNAAPRPKGVPTGMAPPMGQRQSEMSASTLASLPPDAQKQMIGEKLYNKIHPRHGQKTGKITGMLLEMDVSELLHLLEDEEALKVKENEALKVLNEHKA